MTPHLLDNIVWHTLAGPHAKFAAGTSTARRYARGFSPIVGFADSAHPDFAALQPHCEPGESFYCAEWSGTITDGWQLDSESTMHQMVWDAPLPDADPGLDAVTLGPEHAAQMLDLVALTHPGPFGPRTVELGEYVGCFVGQRLVAMAGERMCAGPLREISGVCTHPDFQGRGLARRLVAQLVQREMARRETPFLHVMRENRAAHDLYERMGFCDVRETVIRVLSWRP